MKYLIRKTENIEEAVIELPASKSISNRALILDALSYSPYGIENLADCDDTHVLVRALNSNGTHFDIGAAGTAMRFLTAFLSKVVGEWTITGSERMKNRPIGALVEAINALGGRIEYMEKDGFPPLRIYGSALQGGEIRMPGNISSQYISALLMIAPLMEKGLTVRLEGEVISEPYIRLTLGMMESYGVRGTFQGNSITVPPQEYRPIRYTVEPDWSAASYWFEIGALSQGDMLVRIPELRMESLQGDSACRMLFELLGIRMKMEGKDALLRPNGKGVSLFEYNFIEIPDLAQTFAVTCALKGVPFRFTGLQSLRIKETDRIEALKRELKKLGYVLTDTADTLAWDGERCEQELDPVIETYEDHRMAMAFAPAALVRPEGITVANPQVVTKSYPGYWDDLKKAGFTITEVES